MSVCFSRWVGVFLEKCLLDVSRGNLSMVVAPCEIPVVDDQTKLNVVRLLCNVLKVISMSHVHSVYCKYPPVTT